MELLLIAYLLIVLLEIFTVLIMLWKLSQLTITVNGSMILLFIVLVWPITIPIYMLERLYVWINDKMYNY